jgi:hypothetical protein
MVLPELRWLMQHSNSGRSNNQGVVRLSRTRDGV